MDQVYQGMVVEDARGPIGVVQRVATDANGAQTIVIERNDGTQQTLSGGNYAIYGDVLHLNDAGLQAATTAQFDPMRTQQLPVNEIATAGAYASVDQATTRTTNLHEHTTLGSDQATRGAANVQTADLAPGEELKIPVIREDVVVQKRAVEGGGVRVHKTVTEREQVVEQPTLHEDVEVERVAIGRVIEAAPEARQEGDTLVIPVVEEMLVVEKRLVLREEIRITKRRTQQVEQARVVLREEQVQIEQINEANERGAGF